MAPTNSIRLLAADNNKRGDLFTRLAKDLFFALGYDNLRLDVHKSGRELDLQGSHRLEPRRVIAECKAHAGKMGGSELNKFFGALTRERKKIRPVPVSGYFVSLGGFTETGIEQEIDTDEDRLVLLDAEQIVKELTRCRVIVGFANAIDRAGRCAEYMGLDGAVLDGFELLGHDRGYIWSIYYSVNKQRTHVALIHADGTPLSVIVAKEIFDADRQCGGALYSLMYVCPPTPTPDRAVLTATVLENYQRWIGEECGYIQLDGLPADTELSATRLKLERLFVALKAVYHVPPDDQSEDKQGRRKNIFSIGKLLEKTPHIAVLAKPGGGKSTLIKRLATAYAFPLRHREVADGLPQRDWLPLILRCRELRDRAHRPIIELLSDIPRHAGMSTGECVLFQDLMHTRLQAGEALLLIDGLDEISDEGARQTFANHLRSFLAMFPHVALVITSREAGFRLVAGVIASACEQVRLAPLDKGDVINLCERWHVEVLADTEKVRSDAKNLGISMWNNSSIRTLTENPLLLTTLLVVKRSAGELPRNRTSLYREAIRVLVRTWNVEGYAPMDEGETLAQLSYVACAMMEAGQQQISESALLRLLSNSRRELEAELQFTAISPHQFMERIEYRSSLLMQTGHERVNGVLEPIYEFRHLTFQEYLAALGYAEEQYQGRDEGKSLADVLEPYFRDERWREVIPLAAVLAKRKAEELVSRLTMACEQVRQNPIQQIQEHFGVLLYKCMLDEVQLTAPALKNALRIVAMNVPRGEFGNNWVGAILRGKFGAIFQEIVERGYLSNELGFEKYLMAFSDLTHYGQRDDVAQVASDHKIFALQKVLENGERIEKIRASLNCMMIAFKAGSESSKKGPPQSDFQPLVSGLEKMLASGDAASVISASWAFAWLGTNQLLSKSVEPGTILHLYRAWFNAQTKSEARIPVWALATHRLLPRDTFEGHEWGNCEDFLLEAAKSNSQGVASSRFILAAIVVGWYRRGPWSDEELAEMLIKYFSSQPRRSLHVIELLKNLGEAGRLALGKILVVKNEKHTMAS